MPRYVAVTGCAGFIGRVVTQKLLGRGDYVYGVDAMTYAADPDFVRDMLALNPRTFTFVPRNIRDLGRWPDVDAVIHLAAETHVDNSTDTPTTFVETNVNGTAHLLELTRRKSQGHMPHFIHVSTDEVYGSCAHGAFAPDAPLRPSSPYAASKAAADMLVQSWGATFSVPYSIVRPTNVYGPSQYPEKLIPKAVRSRLLERPMTVHGDGSQTRCWLHVEDAADALIAVLDKRCTVPIINVGGNTEASVRDIVDAIGNSVPPTFDHVRPAQDTRYAVDDAALRAAGWTPKGDLWKDLPALVASESRRFRF